MLIKADNVENDNNKQFQRNDVFSKRIRAGKRRTYFSWYRGSNWSILLLDELHELEVREGVPLLGTAPDDPQLAAALKLFSGERPGPSTTIEVALAGRDQ